MEYKGKKKCQIGIFIVLKNYKYTKSLFLNTLKCNYVPTKTKRKIIFFLNTRLARNFVVDEIRAFTVMMLKILAFIISKC